MDQRVVSDSPAASVLNAVTAPGIKKQAKMSKPELQYITMTVEDMDHALNENFYFPA